nr:probable LRR receptor-like serine/threonine-protein kinase At1g53440 [Malus domestica]
MENRYCPENNPKYHSLFINCGGGETTVRGNKYDQDNDTSLSYTSPKKNWAYSVSGGYGVPESNTSNYIRSMTCGVPITEAPLYEKARLSPVSLKYYAFCLRKGNYTVTLYFNEVVYTKNEDYTNLRKRVFDVYIQDVRRLNYVNIREKKGSEPITENISAVVVSDSGLLNIHFYWPGKGSYQYQPSFNGPLISAISVTPEFKISSDKNNGQRVALITLASIVAALPLSLAFAWKMGWLSSEEFRSKSIS